MNVRIKGVGKMENDAVEMKDPMQDLVENQATTDQVEAPKVIDSRESPLEELLPPSNKPGFDASEVQDARRDDVNEGGITRNKTTGSMKSTDPAQEGGLVRKEPLADSTVNAYEVSGFHVEMSTATGMVAQQVTVDFPDLDTAKASVNGDMFLMPKAGGFKACRITRGAPIICFNERQILEYINGAWRKP